MQVTEANTDGLKRTLKVVVGSNELNDRFSARLDEVKDTVQLKGFRRGKVPVQHIKKVFGRSLMAEVVQKALEESSSQGAGRPQGAPGVPAQDRPHGGQDRDRERHHR